LSASGETTGGGNGGNGGSSLSASTSLAGGEELKALQQQLVDLQTVADKRMEEIERQMMETDRLKEKIKKMERELEYPSKERIKSSVSYKKLQTRLTTAQNLLQAAHSNSLTERQRFEQTISSLLRQIEESEESKRSLSDLFHSKLSDLDLQLSLLHQHQSRVSSLPPSSFRSLSLGSTSAMDEGGGEAEKESEATIWERQQKEVERLRAENTSHIQEVARLKATLDSLQSSSSSSSSSLPDSEELHRTNQALQAEVEAIAQVLSDLEQENSTLKESLKIKEECNQKLSTNSLISTQHDSSTREKVLLLEETVRLLSPQLQRKDETIQLLNDQLLILRSQLVCFSSLFLFPSNADETD